MFNQKIQRESGRSAFREELDNYYIEYIPVEGAKTIFVTFEASMKKQQREDVNRPVFAEKFLQAQGVSVVGVKPKGLDWYRKPDLHAFFRNDAFIKLVQGHERVLTHGGSMGGYAALTFARSFPGCEVLAYNPQSTLNPDLVPWERRFAAGQNQDWNGDFADAAEALSDVKKAYIVYDPLFRPDRRHVMRLPQEKVAHIKLPFVQHIIPQHLQNLEILKDTVLRCMDGSLESWFPKAARARKDYEHYIALANFNWAKRLYKQGDFKKSRECLDITLHHRPRFIDAINLNADLLDREREENAA